MQPRGTILSRATPVRIQGTTSDMQKVEVERAECTASPII
jgi:hypothetical protein